MGLGSVLALVLLGGGGSWGPATPFFFFSRSWIVLLAAVVAAAFAEEFFFRGYLHALLRERLSLPGSAGVGGGLFSLVHLLNPGVSVTAAVNIFLAGVLLAFLRERSGSLAGPVGCHAGWNLTLGMLYGLPVSGVNLTSLFRLEAFDLPTWMGGGVFGPEGSLPCTFLLLALLLGWGRKLMKVPDGELAETL
jgi:membrane protease YdiL (CAAX protease family)